MTTVDTIRAFLAVAQAASLIQNAVGELLNACTTEELTAAGLTLPTAPAPVTEVPITEAPAPAPEAAPTAPRADCPKHGQRTVNIGTAGRHGVVMCFHCGDEIQGIH